MFFYICFCNWSYGEVKQDILKPDLCFCISSPLALAVSMYFCLWMLDTCRVYRYEQTIIVYILLSLLLIIFFNTAWYIACSIHLSHATVQFSEVHAVRTCGLLQDLTSATTRCAGASHTSRKFLRPSLVTVVTSMPLTPTETPVVHRHPDVSVQYDLHICCEPLSSSGTCDAGV
jgi:hypothetical protein